jgi:hypothetical protein
MWKTPVFMLVVIATYLVGGVSGRRDWFPWPEIHAARHGGPSVDPPSRYVFDGAGRLVGDESKTEVACPRQTDRTAVLLALGQSNAGNHGGQRFDSQHGEHVVNFFGGKCFIAASPLLGSDGVKGAYWTQLGNLLIESGEYDDVVIAPLAISGSLAARWAQAGDINPLLADLVGRLGGQGYHATEVLWDQGEADYVAGTSADSYRESLLSMIDTLRREGVAAPVYVSIATKCLEPANGGFKTHAADNAIVRAQLALSQGEPGVRRGVNTDVLLADVDRYDDCHMSGSGLNKVAQAWAQILLSNADSGEQAESR